MNYSSSGATKYSTTVCTRVHSYVVSSTVLLLVLTSVLMTQFTFNHITVHIVLESSSYFYQKIS
jgi:hypothetical protein